MNDDMRMIKFETLIKDLEEKLRHKLFKKTNSFFRFNKTNLSLALIYNIEEMNDYAKVIYENTGYLFAQEWKDKYSDLGKEENSRVKINAGKEFVRIARNDTDQKYGHKFLFWALMVLAVDDKHKEDCLSLICDYAKMLNVSDNEVMELVNIVKLVFQDSSAKKVTNVSVRNTFDEVLKKYEPTVFHR